MFFFSSGAYSTPVCPADPAKSFSCLNIHLKLLIHSDTQTVHSLVLDWFSKIYNPQRMNRDCVSPIGDAVFCWCLKVEKSYAGYCAPGAFLHSQTTLTRKNTQNIYFLPHQTWYEHQTFRKFLKYGFPYITSWSTLPVTYFANVSSFSTCKFSQR